MNAVERLQEIQEQMFDLVSEAYNLLPSENIKDRSYGYWRNQIKAALGDSDFSSMYSLQDAIDDTEEWYEENSEDDEE